jgi:hypothetical protein
MREAHVVAQDNTVKSVNAQNNPL